MRANYRLITNEISTPEKYLKCLLKSYKETVLLLNSSSTSTLYQNLLRITIQFQTNNLNISMTKQAAILNQLE